MEANFWQLYGEAARTSVGFFWKAGWAFGSRSGWNLVGHRFVSDWKMVWEEILIGFTIAGFVAVFVPAQVWESIFLQNYVGLLPDWLITLENARVAPFVAVAAGMVWLHRLYSMHYYSRED